MKHSLLVLVLLGAPLAHAYEYKLQFTPASGAQGSVVAGYQFQGGKVVGNCSYHVTTSGSGRGGHGHTTYYYNTCTWDLYGNLISATTGAPSIPNPIGASGTETIYATSGASSTGHDSRGYGFVSTPSSHYSWQTPNGGYAVIPYSAQTITATLASDGDYALKFSGARVVAGISGYITPSSGTATVAGTTCSAAVAAGATCSVTVTYDPTSIVCTGDAYGYAYTNIDLSIVTDSGATIDFTEGFTVTGVPMCDGGGGGGGDGGAND